MEAGDCRVFQGTVSRLACKGRVYGVGQREKSLEREATTWFHLSQEIADRAHQTVSRCLLAPG